VLPCTAVMSGSCLRLGWFSALHPLIRRISEFDCPTEIVRLLHQAR
jgi:hypothetical protein